MSNDINLDDRPLPRPDPEILRGAGGSYASPGYPSSNHSSLQQSVNRLSGNVFANTGTSFMEPDPRLFESDWSLNDPVDDEQNQAGGLRESLSESNDEDEVNDFRDREAKLRDISNNYFLDR